MYLWFELTFALSVETGITNMHRSHLVESKGSIPLCIFRLKTPNSKAIFITTDIMILSTQKMPSSNFLLVE